MIRIRKGEERGHFDHGWLNTYHTFSFGAYYDPQQMGFRSLRVMNEDWVQPGQGFGMHPHRDMEIVTCVLEGALEHRDSLGNGAVLHPGEFQHMSAGTGIRHSEFNPSSAEPVHLYQVWLLPARESLPPSYAQKVFPDDEKQGRLRLVASPDGEYGSLKIQQDARIYLCLLDSEQQVAQEILPGRHAWLQILRGSAELNGHPLRAGDGAAVSDERLLSVRALGAAEVMLFDLA